MRRTIAIFAGGALLVGTLLSPALARGTPTISGRHVMVNEERKLEVVVAITDYGEFPAECAEDVPARVQRRVRGRWVTKKRGRTNSRGKMRIRLSDLEGRYRGKFPTFNTKVAEEPFECPPLITPTLVHQHD